MVEASNHGVEELEVLHHPADAHGLDVVAELEGPEDDEEDGGGEVPQRPAQSDGEDHQDDAHAPQEDVLGDSQRRQCDDQGHEHDHGKQRLAEELPHRGPEVLGGLGPPGQSIHRPSTQPSQDPTDDQDGGGDEDADTHLGQVVEKVFRHGLEPMS